MPNYVYALHDFTPENPDEVSLKVGERVEVVEKDDLYGDGWWQGRNTSGKVGLFPQSYTSPNPPSSSVTFPNSGIPSSSAEVSNHNSSAALQPLPEESGAGDGSSTALKHVHERQASEEMMKATMTDVQKAIEQLGRSDHDGSRSFSFASSHGDSTGHSEAEIETDDEDSPGWHKNTREKLALRAQQENEQRQAKEATESSGPSTPLRSVAPPIDVEMSDESEDEDEVHLHRSPRRHSDGALKRQPHIPEEDEEEDETMDFAPHPVITIDKAKSPKRKSSSESTAHIVPSEDFIVPSPGSDESDLPTATGRTSSPVPSSPTLPAGSTFSSSPEPLSALVEPGPEPMMGGGIAILEKTAAEAPEHSEAPTPTPALVRSSSPPVIVAPQPITATPSTARVAEQLPFSASSALPSPTTSSAGSLGYSSAGIRQMLTPATTVLSFKTGTGTPLALPYDRSTLASPSPDSTRKPGGHPSEWTMEEVVEWLKSKGFDQGVCDKFIEQEITGDVLLELDANVLKTEIGIAAFGKRVRIANAITELRRPPSVSESEHPQPVMTPQSQSHSMLYSHSHSASIQSSGQQSWANSPMYPTHGFSPALSTGVASATSMEESPLHSGEIPTSPSGRNGWRESDPTAVSATTTDSEQAKTAVGLGLGLTPAPANGKEKSRPVQLVITASKSDGTLGVKAVGEEGSGMVDEDRTALSESETSHAPDSSKNKRRRLFGRSADSGSLKKSNSFRDFSRNNSKDAIAPSTPPSASGSPTDVKTGTEEELGTRRQARGRRSMDERKPTDRLSLFGGTFAGTIGKARKPPPRLSTADSKAESGKHEKHSMGTFSRMRDKRSSSRPSTSDGQTHKEKEKRVKEAPIKEVTERKAWDSKDPTVLRKRTASAAEVPIRPNTLTVPERPGPTLKPGQSILTQIGTSDHNGWMRKKGDRYNSWKLRYFVLKGPHLYCLRSNDKAETKIKGYVNIVGYRVVADENADPGRYGFRIVHDTDKTHSFSSEEQSVIREWMKALMKATISRDYTSPVTSSCNVSTIPLTVAQAMNPAPRPPSPTARDATQKALRRENPNQLSSRDAQVLLMGLPAKEKTGQNGERTRLESFFTNDTISTNGTEPPLTAKSFSPKTVVPPRPSREMRRMESSDAPVDPSLLEWANSHLPSSLHIKDSGGPLSSGLALLRLAENIKGKPSVPSVPDSAFPTSQNDEKLDGLFRLFDYLLDNDVKMGTVSINDIRTGKREKIVQLLRAMKSWEEKRKTAQTIVTQGLGSSR